MYWPSTESTVTSGTCSLANSTAVCAESNRRGLHPLLQQGSYDGSSTAVMKSFQQQQQQQQPMNRACFLQSPMGALDSQIAYGGTGDYSACAFGADFPWSVVSMVPPGNYRDGALDSGDTDSSLAMDLSKVSSKRRPGGRRPKEDSTQLSPEEEEKRRLRRLRNKEAAARCRRRRVEHMCRLEGEVEELLMDKERLQDELAALQQEKMKLEAMLENHLPYCSMPCGGGGESSSEDGAVAAAGSYNSDDTTVSVKSIAQESNKSSGPSSPCADGGALSRPKSLDVSLIGRTPPDMPIETPSKIFFFDPFSMPTGMTPVSHKEVDAVLAPSKGYLPASGGEGGGAEDDDRSSTPPCSSANKNALVTL